MRRTVAILLITGLTLAAVGCSGSSPSDDPLVIGAVYPTTGPDRLGGLEELRGVKLAVEKANDEGGVDGRPIQVRSIDVPAGDAAPSAVAQLDREGVDVVLGTNGSTISFTAAQAAARRGMLFWETGAVGEMSSLGRGRLVFRVAPSGLMLGGDAMRFVTQRLAPMLHRDPKTLRYAVTYVNDVYGTEVARGAMQEIHDLGLNIVARVPYDTQHFSPARVVHRLAQAHPDVVFVSAYIDDGVAIRREIVREHLPILVNIGTSSSFCMPAFGARLGRDAVGAFASDKPAAEYINLRGLRPEARALAREVSESYEERYGEEMGAAGLAGFSAAWTLLHHVMPRTDELTPDGIAAAARGLRLPMGSLPNGSGIEFGPVGSPEAGWNLRAAGVIWEWLGVNHEAVVWPPRLATATPRVLAA